MDSALPDLFLCTRLNCRLTPAACVRRQNVVGQVARNTAKAPERPPQFAMCDPEKCEQGAEIRRTFGDGGGPKLVRTDGLGVFFTRRAPTPKHKYPTTETEEETMETTRQESSPNTRTKRTCSECGKKLRASSIGERCFRCRLASGEAKPGHVLAARAAAEKEAERFKAAVRTVEPSPAAITPTPTTAPAPSRDLSRVRDLRSLYSPLEVDQLVAHREAIHAELTRRLAQRENELETIRKALGVPSESESAASEKEAA